MDYFLGFVLLFLMFSFSLQSSGVSVFDELYLSQSKALFPNEAILVPSLVMDSTKPMCFPQNVASLPYLSKCGNLLFDRLIMMTA